MVRLQRTTAKSRNGAAVEGEAKANKHPGDFGYRSIDHMFHDGLAVGWEQVWLERLARNRTPCYIWGVVLHIWIYATPSRGQRNITSKDIEES